jgi:hypothetical protein
MVLVSILSKKANLNYDRVHGCKTEHPDHWFFFMFVGFRLVCEAHRGAPDLAFHHKIIAKKRLCEA